MDSILSQTWKPTKTIVVLDQCTDGSECEVKNRPIDLVIRKSQSGSWDNSLSENLEIARKYVDSEFYAVVDADVVLPRDYFAVLFREMDGATIVSGEIITASQNPLGKLVRLWEQTYRLAPLGRFPRGCALLVSKRFIDEIGGFRDVPAWETYLLQEARSRGHKVAIISGTKAYHTRTLTLRGVIDRQIRSGKARRMQGWPLWRTILHSVLRLRPFVIWGYIRWRKSTS